ncbi:unnamed protein product, partial [Musa hybrid cultivar]
ITCRNATCSTAHRRRWPFSVGSHSSAPVRDLSADVRGQLAWNGLLRERTCPPHAADSTAEASIGSCMLGLPRRRAVPVNGQAVQFAARMLELDSLGHGGVKISTAVSHTNRTIFGANSMKQVSQNTACLAFPDAGPKAEQAVVISGFQTERPRLSYSSTLYAMKTTCGNFDLTLRSRKLKWHYIA